LGLNIRVVKRDQFSEKDVVFEQVLRGHGDSVVLGESCAVHTGKLCRMGKEFLHRISHNSEKLSDNVLARQAEQQRFRLVAPGRAHAAGPSTLEFHWQRRPESAAP